MMEDMFYRDFEGRYRGSFELIKSRLEIYLPFVLPFKIGLDKPAALDIGCGRGEWLELLQQNGFQARGVDLDGGMMQECHARNLDVFQGDGIVYLKKLENECLDIISAFHVVEHIPFETLRCLVSEAYRVLKPGGLLILETPNPESLLMGTSFYLDPTHIRPLPVQLLSFTVECARFDRVKSLFLQEPSNVSLEQKINLYGVLHGVSPDYAVVAQKAAEPSMLALFDQPFSREHGNRLLPLVMHYDQQVDGLEAKLENKIGHLEGKIGHLEGKIGYLEGKIGQLEAKVEQLMRVYLRIYHSKPWRLVKQLRKTMHFLQRFIRHVFVCFLYLAVYSIPARSRLKRSISDKLYKYPFLKKHMFQLLAKIGLIKFWHFFQSTRDISIPIPSKRYILNVLSVFRETIRWFFIKAGLIKYVRTLKFWLTQLPFYSKLKPQNSRQNEVSLQSLSPRAMSIYQALKR